MSSITDLIMQQIGQQGVSMITQKIGASDEKQTSTAIGAALPLLMTAMAKNAQKEEGAQALAGALDRDHDGSILENLGGFLSNDDGQVGNSILGHVLGNKTGMISGALGQMSGLNQNQSGSLLATLAPIVLGSLGQQKRQNGLDAGGLASILLGEKQKQEENNPQEMGMVGKLLDADGDGSYMDDVAEIGMNMLGNFLRGRK